MRFWQQIGWNNLFLSEGFAINLFFENRITDQ